MTGPNSTLFDCIIAAGINYDHHESDLYIPDTPATRALIQAHNDAQATATNPYRIVPQPFTCKLTNTAWLDLPFQYMPYHEQRGQA